MSERAEPPPDCVSCPRLSAYRGANRATEPLWHNAPVASFGPDSARALIVGLAPGLKGANRTGRPFTGDGAGDVLFDALARCGLTRGVYDRRADDGLTLAGCMITNAVRCVPPQNKPSASEIANCRPFLAARIRSLPHLKAILVLGRIAHDSVFRALGESPAGFAHGAQNRIGAVIVFTSYHCSRYNMNTRRLTVPMLDAVLGDMVQVLRAG